MCRSYVDRLRFALLEAGIAPRYARRLAAEVEDHLLAAAEAQACARMGRVEDIVEAARRDARNLSVARRFPWLVFVVSPAAVLLMVGIGYGVGAAAVFEALRPAAASGLGVPDLAEWLLGFGNVAVAPLVLAGYVGMAWRTRCAVVWPVVAGVVIALLRAIVAADVAVAAPGAAGGDYLLSVGVMAPPSSVLAWMRVVLRPEMIVTILTLVAGVALVARTRRSAMTVTIAPPD